MSEVIEQWQKELPTRYQIARYFDAPSLENWQGLVRAWGKSQLGEDPRWDIKQKVNISICGFGTLQYLQPYIVRASLADGFIPQINIGGYNQLFQELATQNQQIINDTVDLVWLFCGLENLLPPENFLDYSALVSEDGITQASKAIENLIHFLKDTRENFNGLILINDFFPTLRSPFGVADSGREVTYSNFFARVNNELQKFIRDLPYSGVFPISGLIGRYGSERAIDRRLQLLADCPFSEGFFFEISQEVRPYLRGIKGTIRKVLVLDLDDTLWGGVVGEDGWNGINLGPDPTGKAFSEFQKAILGLYKRGTVLAINSKNNLEDIQEVFQKRDDMILKLEFFAAIRANWDDKAKNCYEIAKEINVGLDSLVFWDDNPAERMLVHQATEEIYVIDPPEDISGWATYIQNISLFDSLHLGTEDMRRGEMYAENRQRKEAEVSSTDLNSYYHSLSLKVECSGGTEKTLPRIVSLLGRTNQFNLTTKRYTEQEINHFIKDTKWEVRCYSAEDCFGSYGLVGVGLITFGENAAFLDSFLLSCRAMGKGIEDSMLYDIAACVRGVGLRTLTASFLPTKKNVPIQSFLPGKGFMETRRNGTEIQYSIDLTDKKIENPNHIEFIKI